MSKKRFSASLNLKGLVNVQMTKKGKDGNPITGVFIPFDLNYITVGEKGYYLNLSGQISDEPDQYENNGFFAHSVPGEVWKNATDEQKEEFKKLEILGNLKIWGHKEPDNSITDVIVDGESEDLPF